MKYLALYLCKTNPMFIKVIAQIVDRKGLRSHETYITTPQAFEKNFKELLQDNKYASFIKSWRFVHLTECIKTFECHARNTLTNTFFIAFGKAEPVKELPHGFIECGDDRCLFISDDFNLIGKPCPRCHVGSIILIYENKETSKV